MGNYFNLKDNQISAVQRMRDGCILQGGVGSGKSRTSLAYFYSQNGGDIYSSKYKDMRSRPLDLYIITTALKRDKKEWEEEMMLYLMSTNPNGYYNHKVVVDSWNNIKKYVDVKNAFFILDEQRLVGSGTWVKSFYKIAKNNRWILLTATPGDTFMDFVPLFVANGFYKNKTEFAREHVIYVPRVKFPKISHYVNTRKLIYLKEKLTVVMESPRDIEYHHNDVFLPYDKELYKKVTRERWDPYNDTPILNASGLCYIWRKVVNSDVTRILKIQELTKQYDRIIVFYNFNYELEMLRNAKWDEDIELAEWNGHKHQEVPHSKRWLYFVQYTAGCEGWNCITTDTMVFYSQNYSYKVMTQAAGRTDRMNTPFKKLYYYHLKSKSGIDLAINKSLKNKKKFNEVRYTKDMSF